MLAVRLRLLVLPLAIVLAACSGSAPTPAPQPTPPDDAAFLLRIETEQAIPPLERFGWMPVVLITRDGGVLAPGAVPAIFPGPLVGPIVQRRLEPAGWERIVALARASGLLGGASLIGDIAPGETILRVRMVADGVTHDVSASNKAVPCLADPCQGPPGSREAFFGFVSRLQDLEAFLGADIGAEQPWVPDGYAIVVGAVPDDEGLAQPALDWPFAARFDAFGKPLADGSGFRCGTVVGEDAATLRPILEAATQITAFRDPVDGSLRGLTVRPLLPGDGDPCAGLV